MSLHPVATAMHTYAHVADTFLIFFPRRDDLTVQVIFFGNGEKTGEVLLNEEATTPPRAAVGAKL